MQDGYPRVTFLVALAFMLTAMQDGIFDIVSNGMEGVWYDATARKPANQWAFILVGSLVTIAAAGVIIVYVLSNPLRWSETNKVNWVVYAFLLLVGLRSVVLALLDVYLDNVLVRQPKGLLYGLITCMLPLLYIFFRKSIRQYLGKRWLKHRLHNVGTEFTVSISVDHS
jgi:hypothetical protein